MPKTNFLKTWKDSRTELQNAVKAIRPAPAAVKEIADLLKKAEPMEKALAELDKAFEKGHRKDAALVSQKVWKICADFTFAIKQTEAKVLPASDALADEVLKLTVILSRIVSAGPEAIKKLQESKGQVMKVQAFLGDFEQEKAKFEKAIKSTKAAADLEKTYKLASNDIPRCLKPLKEYSIAAGRADAKKALQAIDEFVAKCKILENNCSKIHDLVGTMRGYGTYPDALKQLFDFAKNLREGRVKETRNDLAKLAK